MTLKSLRWALRHPYRFVRLWWYIRRGWKLYTGDSGPMFFDPEQARRNVALQIYGEIALKEAARKSFTIVGPY